MNPEDTKPPIEIPKESLTDEALNGVIESFILREGTDYGINEASMDTKKSQVQRKIIAGDVKIIFDPNSESVCLMNKVDWLNR